MRLNLFQKELKTNREKNSLERINKI